MLATTVLNKKKTAVNVAICGNPNSGKTTIFNAITGLKQRVANYPGVTVEKTVGQFRVEPSGPHRHRHRHGHKYAHAHGDEGTTYNLIDIPGAYSLAAFSPDEYIAARALFGDFGPETAPDVIVCVIDATQLERGLYLLFQTLQIGRPTLVALNMMDLAQRRGMKIDVNELSRQLGGLTVVPVIGSKGKGITELKQAVARLNEHASTADFDIYHPATIAVITRLEQLSGRSNRSRAEYLRVLFDVGGPAERQYLAQPADGAREALDTGRAELAEQFGSLTAAETASLTQTAAAIAAASVRIPATRETRSERIDRFLLHPVLGPVILVTLMALIFQSIFAWAEPVMRLIDQLFAHLGAVIGTQLPEGPVKSLLVDGVIGGVGSVLVFLPQIVILFLFIAILEDSGYMPRMAFLVDRAFRWCGLSGKSFIPLLSSFACAVPGIMATRTIEDRKLRFITIMVAPLMTCSARLPVYAIMIAAFIPHRPVLGLFNTQGLLLGALYLLGLVVAVIVSLILKKTLFKTQRGTFMMELPSYKVPTARSVSIRVFNRARQFVLRAGTVILAITIIIWALSYYPHSESITRDFEARRAAFQQEYAGEDQKALDARLQELGNEQAGAQLRNSYLGRIGHAVDPVFEPLGWDWKITMATLASFPAREVVIATLGTIYNLGSDPDHSGSLVEKMREARWEYGPKIGQTVFNPAVALSIMVFFALCCQCGATVVTIKQETGAWKYAVGVFTYMTVAAYLGAMATYQIFSRLWS
ncbi:ferrous iron transport protein B [candidate division GN15 bacterium]|uniref:Ferrous iron transport protein B n=1 Tax=candidate division GN15 bacterium TaxID=2072418 RepID=A0A855X3N3_9BACT|nr:MAG: ferrous iron transport protein B [candidate division GN15 bacterium]